VTPQEAILAGVNRKIGYLAMLRELLAHTGWRVPRANPNAPPTILVTDENMTPAAWLLSDEAAHNAAAKEFHAAAVGAIWRVTVLEDVIADLDPKIVVLRIDPGSAISLNIQTDQLDAFRRLARGARVERAMAEQNYADIKRFDAYFVPYFGELGQGHNVIALPTEHGQMVAAFTAEDRVETFLATGSEADRGRVKFVRVDGVQLFGTAGPTLAQGVIVNYGSEHPFGFMLDACRDIAAA
jgi:hypothetical protein